MTTLRELATAWVHLSLTVIHEFSSDFPHRYRELRAEIRDKVNPLLVKHGEQPLDIDALVEDPDSPDF